MNDVSASDAERRERQRRIYDRLLAGEAQAADELIIDLIPLAKAMAAKCINEARQNARLEITFDEVVSYAFESLVVVVRRLQNRQRVTELVDYVATAIRQNVSNSLYKERNILGVSSRRRRKIRAEECKPLTED